MSENDWDVDEYLGKIWPRSQDELSGSFAEVTSPKILDRDVSDEMLEESYLTMAQIVKLYGERYLPIFERLHEEIQSRENKKALLDAALKAAKDGPDPLL